MADVLRRDDTRYDHSDPNLSRYVFDRKDCAWRITLWPGKRRYFYTGSRDFFVGAPRAYVMYAPNKNPSPLAPRHTMHMRLFGLFMSASWGR